MSDSAIKAVSLDLDGVITRTATVHARAWKTMFDEYLSKRPRTEGEDQRAFQIDSDYPRFVDGKPRYDGVRSFLQSRGISLPEGSPDDEPGKESVCGLGNRKNEIFLELIDEQGAAVYEDAVEQLDRWREQGLPLAVATSSRNGEMILRAAGLIDKFNARLDGKDIQKLGLQGKPAPDMFLEATRRLGVEPADTMLVEDAVSGVQAGRAGGFGLVVGVARDRPGDVLADAGADVVVRDLRDLARRTATQQAGQQSQDTQKPPSALENVDEIISRLRQTPPVLFLDYDGTLTPIVEHPEDALISPRMKQLLRELARGLQVAIVSGRDLHDVRKMVGLEELVYAGSHGFDILGPGDLRMQQEAAKAALPALDAAEERLTGLLADIKGARIERKGFAIAVHYRQVSDQDADRLEMAVDRVREEHEELRKKGGKKIFELQPDVPWDKGRAVLYLMTALGLDRQNILPIYIGDDVTDEDAFQALAGRGLGIRCGSPEEPTAADYLLADVGEVERFLQVLKKELDPKPRS